MDCAFGDVSINSLPNPRSHMLSSRSFMVLFYIKSVIPCELIFMKSIRPLSRSFCVFCFLFFNLFILFLCFLFSFFLFFGMWRHSYSITVCWRDHPFSILSPLLFCQRSFDYTCMGLFSGFFFLFLWSICLFFHQYYTVFIAVGL